MRRFKFAEYFCSRPHYYYQLSLRRTLQRSVLYSAFTKCTILAPLREGICKDNSFFEADASLQTKHNNPIVSIFPNSTFNRGKTSGQSDYTDESVIRKRFAVYTNETEPVAGHYKKEKKFQSIKGEGSVDDIFNSISAIIDKKMK